MPDDLRLAPAEAMRLAQDLIDDGRPFHAHEVLEAAWKSAPVAERAVWKGLAQIAVGLTHARRGNSRGAVTLLRRGAAAITDYAVGYGAGTGPAETGPGATGPAATGPAATGPAATRPAATGPAAVAIHAGTTGPAGIDLAEVTDGAKRLADRIARLGLDAVPPADLRVTLTA
jgi:hypothetical protein